MIICNYTPFTSLFKDFFFFSFTVLMCDAVTFYASSHLQKSYRLSKFSVEKDAFVSFYSIVPTYISALISELWAVRQHTHLQNCNRNSLHLRGIWKSVISIIDLSDSVSVSLVCFDDH